MISVFSVYKNGYQAHPINWTGEQPLTMAQALNQGFLNNVGYCAIALDTGLLLPQLDIGSMNPGVNPNSDPSLTLGQQMIWQAAQKIQSLSVFFKTQRKLFTGLNYDQVITRIYVLYVG